MTSYTTEQFSALKKSSDEYVSIAMDPARSRRMRIDGGFEAAYFGYIVALARCDKLVETEDHPNADLANAAGIELGLSVDDRALAEKLAHAYYVGTRDKFDPEEVLGWAQRVREAVWGEMSNEILVIALSGGVWQTAPVEEQPSITLRDWRVIQLPDGARHFVGWNVESREGRVSSKIDTFDPSTMRGVTATGRVYELVGRPGHNSDADYVLGRWLRAYELTRADAVDIGVELGPPQGEHGA